MTLLVFNWLVMCFSRSSYTYFMALTSWGLIMVKSGPLAFNSVAYESVSKVDTLSWLMVFLAWFSIYVSVVAMKPTLLYFLHKSMMGLIKSLGLIVILCFLMNKIIYFYIFFEVSVVPMFIMVMGWGYQPERAQASVSLFFYTLFASLPLLCLVVFFLSKESSTLSQFYLLSEAFPQNSLMAMCLFSASATAFLVKLPMFTAHLWLPKAHVEAPVVGSMILASIMLKLGGYGVIRFSCFLGGDLGHLVVSLSLLGGLTISVICLSLNDLKMLVAYSSVSHMAFAITTALSASLMGGKSCGFVMLAHGLSSSGMFLMAYMIYEISGSRNIQLSKGGLLYFPMLFAPWALMVMANMGTPPSLNFFAEVHSILSMMSLASWSGAAMAATMFLSTAYSATLFSKVVQGKKASLVWSFGSINYSYALSVVVHLFLIYSLFFSKLELLG